MFIAGIPTSSNHLEYLVEAHLAKGDKLSAIRTLHHFEEQQKFLPQRAYTRVISAYVASTSRHVWSPTPQRDKATAWDLFAHMRLVAHPRASRESYNAMIFSCADVDDPQPERALDLLKEMEQDAKVFPDGETFDAAILTCSRVRQFNFEGFRLFRRMLRLHQTQYAAQQFVNQQDMNDAQDHDHTHVPVGITGYEPTLATFNALLASCKKRGDIARARWLMGQVNNLIKSGAGQGLDQEFMVNMFHSYAAFKPVIGRHNVKTSSSATNSNDVAKETASLDHEATESASSPEDATAATQQQETPMSDETEPTEVASTEHPTTSSKRLSLLDIGSPDFAPPSGPQTRHEAMQEATRLFYLMLRRDPGTPFETVALSSRLVNAYLGVCFSQMPLPRAMQKWFDIWDEPAIKAAGIKKNGWSFELMLDWCASHKISSGNNRMLVSATLGKVWKEYLDWEAAVIKTDTTTTRFDALERRQFFGLGPRQVERTWKACIKALTR